MKAKSYLISGFQAGAPLHKGVFKVLKNIAKKKKAGLLLVPIHKNNSRDLSYEECQKEIKQLEIEINFLKDLSSKTAERRLEKKYQRLAFVKKTVENYYPPEITQYLLEENQIYKLSSKVEINTCQMSPTIVQPLSGSLKDLVDNTTIFGATKFSEEVVHSSNIKKPKIMMTTAACTVACYNSTRNGQIAYRNHTFGAVFVKIVGDKEFHIRNVPVDIEKLKAYDINEVYTTNKSNKHNVKGIVLGDIHTMFLDPQVDEASDRLIKKTKPKYVVLHDIFDAYSISHWHVKNKVICARKGIQAVDKNGVHLHNNLERELEQVADYLCDKIKKHPKVQFVVVNSNHDRALERFIQEGRFIDDPINSLLGAKLFVDVVQGGMALESYFKKHCPRRNILKKVKFLTVDDDFLIEGVQCANHGDAGLSGAKGSIKSEALAVGKSVIGHSHTPRIFNSTYQVGTSSFLKLEYNTGFSNWLNTLALIHDDGYRQLINIINGEFE